MCVKGFESAKEKEDEGRLLEGKVVAVNVERDGGAGNGEIFARAVEKSACGSAVTPTQTPQSQKLSFEGSLGAAAHLLSGCLADTLLISRVLRLF